MTRIDELLAGRAQHRQRRRRLGKLMSPKVIAVVTLSGFGMALVGIALAMKAVEVPDCVFYGLIGVGGLLALGSWLLLLVGERPDDRRLIAEQVSDGLDLEAVVRFNFDEERVRRAYMLWREAARGALIEAGHSQHLRAFAEAGPSVQGKDQAYWLALLSAKLDVLERIGIPIPLSATPKLSATTEAKRNAVIGHRASMGTIRDLFRQYIDEGRKGSQMTDAKDAYVEAYPKMLADFEAKGISGFGLEALPLPVNREQLEATQMKAFLTRLDSLVDALDKLAEDYRRHQP